MGTSSTSLRAARQLTCGLLPLTASRHADTRMTISSNSQAERPNGSHAHEIDGGGCDLFPAPHHPSRGGAESPMYKLTSLDPAEGRMAAALAAWIKRYGLTRRQAEVLAKAAWAETPLQMSGSLGVSACTIRKHTENLLRKTGDDTLLWAANRLLREALHEACKIDRSSR